MINKCHTAYSMHHASLNPLSSIIIILLEVKGSVW